MKSVDCARWGFDIYADNNGCLAEPSIYAPGMVWLRFVPFDVFSEANVAVLGVIMIVISSLMLVSLARFFPWNWSNCFADRGGGWPVVALARAGKY